MVNIKDVPALSGGFARQPRKGNIGINLTQQDTAPEGFFWSALDYLSRGNYAVNEGVRHLIRGENVLSGIKQGITAKERTSGSEVLEELGFRPTTTSGRIARGTAGLAADVLLDPLNLLFGAGLAGKTAKGVAKGAKVLRTTKARPLVTGGLKARRAVKGLKKTKLAKEVARRFSTKFADIKGVKNVEKFNAVRKAGKEALREQSFKLNGKIASLNAAAKQVARTSKLDYDQILPRLRDAIEANTSTGIAELDALKQPLVDIFGDIRLLDEANQVAQYGTNPNYVARMLSDEAKEKLLGVGIDPEDILKGNVDEIGLAQDVAARRSRKTAKELEEIGRERGFLAKKGKEAGRLVKIDQLFDNKLDRVLYSRARRSLQGVELGEFGKGVIDNFGLPRADFVKNFDDYAGDELGQVIDVLGERLRASIKDIDINPNSVADVDVIVAGLKAGDSTVDDVSRELAKLQAKYPQDKYVSSLKRQFQQVLEDRAGVRTIDTGKIFRGIEKSPLRAKLEGQLFKKDVAQEIERAIGIYNPKNASTAVKYFDTAMNLWKRSTLAYFPAYYSRNIATNAMMMYQGGMSPTDIATYGGDALRYILWRAQGRPAVPKFGILSDAGSKFSKLQQQNMGKLFAELEPSMVKKGVVGNSLSDELAKEAFDVSSKNNSKLAKAFRGEKKVSGKLLETFGVLPEEWSKVSMFLFKRDELMRKAGMSADEATDLAAGHAKKHLIDYSDLTDFEKRVMKRVFPFYTFYRKNIPLQLENLLQDPKRFNVINKIRNNISEDISEGERKSLPRWISEGVPVKLDDNLYITLKDYMPQTGLTDIGASETLNMVNPIITTMWELGNNYNSFYKEPIVDKNRKLNADFLGGLIKGERTAHVLSKFRGIKLMNDVIKNINRKYSTDLKERKKVKPAIHSIIKGITGASIKQLDMQKMKSVMLHTNKMADISLKRQLKKALQERNESDIRELREAINVNRKDRRDILTFKPKVLEID